MVIFAKVAVARRRNGPQGHRTLRLRPFEVVIENKVSLGLHPARWRSHLSHSSRGLARHARHPRNDPSPYPTLKGVADASGNASGIPSGCTAFLKNSGGVAALNHRLRFWPSLRLGSIQLRGYALAFQGSLARRSPIPHQSVMPAKIRPVPTKAGRAIK